MGMHEYNLEIFNFFLEVREKHSTFLRKGSDMLIGLFDEDHSGVCMGDRLKEKQGHLSRAGSSISLPGTAAPETIISYLS